MVTRPARKGNLLAPDLQTLQEPHLAMEQTILTELQGLRGQVRDLRTILMGDGEGETPYGRLPLVETDLKAVKIEVEKLKQDRITVTAYWQLSTVIGHLLTGLGGAVLVVLLERLWKA